VYERGRLPAGVLSEPRQIGIFAACGDLGLLALVVSRRLVKYAMTISPLDGVAAGVRLGSGAGVVDIRAVQQLALVSAATASGWIFDSRSRTPHLVPIVDRLLISSLPLFLYGVATGWRPDASAFST